MNLTKISLMLLFLINALVWMAVFQMPSSKFRIVACDVGQGDAVLAIHGSNQILTDGGPGSSILSCLSRHIPFWDRQIELVVMTHPEKDHYMGLIDVLKNYNVSTLMTSGLDSDSQEFEVLKKEVGSRGIRVVRVQSGQKYRLGMMYLDILHPSEQFLTLKASNLEAHDLIASYATPKSKNDLSIVYNLRFGEFDALLTGDIEDSVSDLVADYILTADIEDLEYIKIPHHGSKNGLSQKLIEVVDPEIAVISNGKNNSYGHPHEEVLKLLSKVKFSKRTDQEGDVVVESNGKEFWVNK